MYDWQSLRLGDMAQGIRGVSYTPENLHETSSPKTVTLLRSNNINSGVINFKNVKFVSEANVSELQIIQKGDIAVCMSNGSKALVGKAARLFDDGARMTVGAFCSIFRPRTGYDDRFVAHVFQSQQYRQHIDVVLAGSAINNLQNKTVENLQLLVPSYLEQQKIAQILDTLDTQIQKTDALIAKLGKIKEGLLHDLITRGIVQNGQLRPTPEQAPELYKESALGLIPKAWEMTSLGQVTDSMVDGPFGSNLKTAHYVEEAGVQVVRLQNIKTGEYDETFTAFITRAHANRLDKNRVVGGDLLVASLGDERSKPGRACLYPTHLPPAINKADCFRVRAHPSMATNSFLMHSLNFERSTKQATSKQQGVTLQRVNLSNLRTIVIGLPTIAEQRLISNELNAFADKISALECEKQKLGSTKNGLMDDLLTGQVRVTPLVKDAV